MARSIFESMHTCSVLMASFIFVSILTLASSSESRQHKLVRLDVGSVGNFNAAQVRHHTIETTTSILEFGNDPASRSSGHQDWSLVDEENEILCQHLQRILKLSGCDASRASEINLLQQHSDHAHARPAEQWPIRRCSLPRPIQPSSVPFGPAARRSHEAVKNACTTVALATSPTGVELAWGPLPSGSLLVVPLLNNSTSQTIVQPEQLVWQSMYRLNSHKYYSEFHDMNAPELGLPDLQFATFIHGYALLQKADWNQDILRSKKGAFYTLAQKFGSSRIAEEHNYSLIYQRHLEEVRDVRGGVLLEIGAGCSLKYGLRESPEIWTHAFKSLAVHLLRGEADRRCLAHWTSHLHSVGVASIHIGQISKGSHIWNLFEQRSNPLTNIKKLSFGAHSNLQAVIATDFGDNEEMEADFRGIFPKIRHGGSYFIENMMRGTWGNPSNMPLLWRYARTASTPLALVASMAVAVAGLSNDLINLPKEQAAAKLSELRHSPRDFLSSSLSLASNLINDVRSLLGTTVREIDEDVIAHKARVWSEDLILTHGRLVDFVECSPGVCVVRKK